MNGNDPIYPEVIVACGLRFLGCDDTYQSLANIYGMSVSFAKRVINMFLDTIDYNNTFEPMQVRLPREDSKLEELAQRWSDVST
jgi:hypothetical protein